MKKIKKTILGVLPLALLMLPALAFASSYTTTYSFSVDLQGTTRSFTGANITVDTYNSIIDVNRTPQYFTVSLYRSVFGADDFIGSDGHIKVGDDTTTWTNVGNGDYYVRLTKENDGQLVSGDMDLYN